MDYYIHILWICEQELSELDMIFNTIINEFHEL